jgi:large subunit ribosomal protein L2
MGVKARRPITPGQRFRIDDDFSDLTKYTPEKSLLMPFAKTGGRDNQGRVSLRFRGGGNKQLYRQIDFKRDKDNIAATVVGIEYDPHRNSRIALLQYEDGEKRYILAPLGIAPGEKIMSGTDIDIKPGNALPLASIPVGTLVHNIEMVPNEGGKIARAAGSGVMLAAKEGEYATIQLPSGEQRKVHVNCRATIGQIGNLDAKNVRKGKAGLMRHIGRKPKVRGVAMNPCDHPHGGGEGRSPVGRKSPSTPWGKKVHLKTRKHRKHSDKLILSRRK